MASVGNPGSIHCITKLMMMIQHQKIQQCYFSFSRSTENFFFIELTLMVRIFSLAMLVYIVVVDACSGKPGRCLKKMDFIQKKMKKMGTEKAEYSYRSLVAPTRQKQKEGVLVFA